MALTRLAVYRPLAILMLILALVILGAYSYGLLPVDRFPKVDFPFVSIVTLYPGASPEDVERDIIKPIEDAVSGISGVRHITSNAREGVGIVSIEFYEDTNADQAAIDVDRRLATIKSGFPEGAKDPSVIKADINALPIMDLTLSGSLPQEELRRLAEDVIKPRLIAVPGVADVTVSGGREREVRVEVDNTKLAGYGIPFQLVAAALQQENLSVPAGSLNEGTQKTNIRSQGLFKSLDEIRNLIIMESPAGTIYLRDVATVSEGVKEQETILRLNGVDTVGLSVTKQSNANAIRVSDALKEALPQIERALPGDTKINITTDSSDFTRQSVAAVQSDLLLAVLITGIVLLLFLHLPRSVFIVILAIPTSLISTFLVMYIMRLQIDALSLLAFGVTVGVLVDDSIVVLENIFRHLGLGEEPKDAAINGRSEIGLAAMAITFTDVVVYLPVAFTGGIVGQFFKEYGLVIVTAVLFSLFVSFTLTPMLASRWFRKGETGEAAGGLWGHFVRLWEAGYHGLSRLYGGVLAWSLHHRWVVILIAMIAIGISISFLPLRLIGFEFSPQEDDGRFTITLTMPSGSSLEATDGAVRQLEDILKREPEVTKILSRVGGGGTGFFTTGGSDTANISVTIVDKKERDRPIQKFMADMRTKASVIPDAKTSFSTAGIIGGAGSTAIVVQAVGDDLDTLTRLANEIEKIVRQVPGTIDVENPGAKGAPEVRAVLDREQLSALGLSAAQVGSTLRTAVTGSQVSKLEREGQPELDITLISREYDRQDFSHIAQIPLGYQNGRPITLGQVATLERGSGPATIKRYDRQRVLEVSSNVIGRFAGDVSTDVGKAVAQIQMPPGYGARLTGMEVEQTSRSFSALTSSLMLSIILIYMLMVALYESWLHPLAIMFSLPAAVVGAFFGLMISGNTLNIFSLLGLIALMGMVTKNAILIVDFTNQLRRRGLSRFDALVEAGRIRLRPILMTTSAVVFALTPFALKLESGAESRAPLAVVIIGGMISSTMLSLILVPVMYTYLDGLQELIKRLFAGRKAPAVAEAPAPAVGASEGLPAGAMARASGGNPAPAKAPGGSE
jgi:HAE1 family hydrophobic/amphiphilic exporter-1